MHMAEVKLQSVSPYSQSKYIDPAVHPKLEKEIPRDYEERLWRERCHYDSDGQVFIPGMAFKNCLGDAAKYLSIQISGKGKSTYTKHFEAGVLVLENLPLGVHKDEVKHEWLFVPPDGKPGGGRRVSKCFPLFTEWVGTVTYHILDDTITRDVFQEHLEQAGKFIGIGRFRPRNRGFYGRFEVKQIQWT